MLSRRCIGQLDTIRWRLSSIIGVVRKRLLEDMYHCIDKSSTYVDSETDQGRVWSHNFAEAHRQTYFSFLPIDWKDLMSLSWIWYNGQRIWSGCQVQNRILHTEIQDGVQDGRQQVISFSYTWCKRCNTSLKCIFSLHHIWLRTNKINMLRL